MLKLVSFALGAYILWNLIRFIYFVIKEAGFLNSRQNSEDPKRFYEKDITGKARIIDEETKNDR
jgi:hypothetical protein